MTMFDDILSLPEQLRWGVGHDIAPLRSDGPIVLLGMGGSAMAATIGTLASTPRSPMIVHRGYGLPQWAAEGGVSVLAVSYSGNTEEVLSGVEQAISADLDLTVIASGGRLGEIAVERSLPYIEVPGGLQPRAGVGYQVAAVMAMLGAGGHVPDPDASLDEAADIVDRLLDGGRGGAVQLGRDLASGLEDRIAVIYGGLGVGSTAAYRWKTQINENAKLPAFSGTVPEMNHNELEGWQPGSSGAFGLIYLRDSADHPGVARRLDLSGTVLSGKVRRVGDVHSTGDGPLARFFSLAVVGDIASVAMAEATGVDPTPVETLEAFKTMLTKGAP
ncbi:MAG: bifunctional phosphoglucose/phosphomannose isomerase [Actinomycetota bacterium]|nr:bifunctional phosphoglucose/phosphomannose isomerase [Actinomycetota bacterium]